MRGKGPKPLAVRFLRTHPELLKLSDVALTRALVNAGVYSRKTYPHDIRITRLRETVSQPEVRVGTKERLHSAEQLVGDLLHEISQKLAEGTNRFESPATRNIFEVSGNLPVLRKLFGRLENAVSEAVANTKLGD